ncbi:hypothetical protein GIB67_037947 [Kingdonia uniflora]|uniref:UBC core domain-containing protein n=1 Tax=Kingdonia uniflora TaxID=39325 RepID=A0A7J7LHG1_9MAGN|nr:hypothetical protein GIB67_037947 [Kingdonia uniflora]
MATVSEGSSTKKLKSDQDDLAEDLLVSTSEMDAELMKEVILEPSKSAGPGSQVSEDLDEDENSEDVDDDENSNSSCYDGMLSDYDDDEYDNETAKLQAQFDAADLPTGVEASISWLKQPTTQSLYDNETEKLQMQFDAAVLPAGVEPSISWMKLPAQSPNFDSQASSTASNSLSSHSGKEKEDNLDVSRDKLPGISISSQPGFSNEEKSADEVLEMFKLFKQFDVVQDYSDHHFTEGYCKSKQPSQNWTKIIQQEWKILEKDLPDTIFVRVFEERMDLLRAAIVGAAGTPYHDGLFFFDVFFPPDYPSIPPVCDHAQFLLLDSTRINIEKF